MAQLAPKLAVGSPLLPTSPQTPQEAEQEQKAQRDAHNDPLRCTESIYMSFFFDGTRNNKEADMPLQKHSNVARLALWLRRGINRLRPTLQAAGIALLLASLAACSQPAAEAPKDSMGLGVGLLNYSDINIGPVYVNGDWAGSIGNHIDSGGRSPIAGIELPKRWRPGLTFQLAWSDDPLYRKDPDALYRRVITVDPYQPIEFSQGYLWIAFFPDGVIKTVVSNYAPGWPGFANDWQEPRNECRWGHNPNCDSSGKLKP